jgi:exodeoxyribonuclease VII small subunit
MKKTEFSYRDALNEIEEILKKIEEGKFDLDQLSEKVKRVGNLLEACKKKLRSTEEEIGKIINGFNASDENQ